MDREKAKELAIFESEKYAHQNGFGKEKSKLQSAFLAGFELAFKNNVDLHNVSQQRELLDCPKCNKQHYISVPLVDKNTCQICKHEWQSYSG